MARYRKIDVRIHGDAKFRRLSSPPPCGKYLWLVLLTHKRQASVPGLLDVGEAMLAEELGWDLEGFRKAFREVSREGLAKADWGARLVWLPNAIKHNFPESPNVIKGWRIYWDELPECPLKDEAHDAISAVLAPKPAFLKAFLEACPKPSPKPPRKPFVEPSPKPMANQEQEQEQEQDPKAAEANPNLTAGSDPTPSGVQRQQQREGSHDAGSGYPIAGPQSDSQSSSEPIRTGYPSGTENDSETPTRPRNLKQALQVPIRERAQVLVDEEHMEIWLEPHRWPEVVELGGRFAAALGWTRPRMTRASDARRLVHLLAAFDSAELDRAVEAAPGDDWLTTGRKGLGSLSVEVVSRLLAPKRVAKARVTRYPHRQPDYEGERTFSAADLFAGGDGYVIAGAGGGR